MTHFLTEEAPIPTLIVEDILGNFQTVQAFTPLYEELHRGLTQFIEKVLQLMLLNLVYLIQAWEVELKAVVSPFDKRLAVL